MTTPPAAPLARVRVARRYTPPFHEATSGAGADTVPEREGRGSMSAASRTQPVEAVTPPPRATPALLRAQALDVLRETFGGDLASPYALLDVPRHGNTGDHAIWLGTLVALEALGAPPPAYTCDDKTYDERALRRRIGDGAILLLGGGNFGDLHAKHQRLRESVAAAFPKNRLVQLPQTIRFTDPAALERARRV